MPNNKEYDYRVIGGDEQAVQSSPAYRIVGVTKNSLNDHIRKAAEDCGFGSYLYARLKETNYILGSISKYPIVVRNFFETITPSEIDLTYARTTQFLFCDDLGESEPDTETQVMPIVEDMIIKSEEFFNALIRRGLDVNILRITPFIARFDELVCGIECEATITYSAC